MADYLRWVWNSPNNGQSPYSMFGGIVRPNGKDGDGNIIYKYYGTPATEIRGACSACK